MLTNTSNTARNKTQSNHMHEWSRCTSPTHNESSHVTKARKRTRAHKGKGTASAYSLRPSQNRRMNAG